MFAAEKKLFCSFYPVSKWPEGKTYYSTKDTPTPIILAPASTLTNNYVRANQYCIMR